MMPITTATASSPSPHSSATLQGSAWVLSLAMSVAVLLFPALWNGFALVFFDTGGYVGRVLEMTLAPGRSIFYGLFLWATSIGWLSFWGPVLAQSLFTLWVIHLVLRCHDLPAGPLATATFSGGLGLLTGISWYTSQLMPDALASLVVLSLWLLGFRWEKLGRSERAGLTALLLLGLLSHMSSMALAIGLSLVILIAWVAQRRQKWPLTVFILPPLAVVASSLLLMPMLHLALAGEATYTPGGPVFIFGRLVQDGIAQRWLADHCPAPGIKLCNLQARLPKTADDFLWAANSPFQDIGGWSGTADAELNYLVKECIKTYPGAFVWTSLRATAQQMTRVATGDGLDEYQPAARDVFSRVLPRTAEAFNAARQQQNQITQPLFNALNKVHVPVAYLSLLGLLLVAGWGLRASRHDLAGLAFFTLTALLGNAFICGALSNPHDRYQSRLAWLATLVVCMTAVCWRQKAVKTRESKTRHNHCSMIFQAVERKVHTGHRSAERGK
ncbi:MAG: hypothetical protein HY885_13200 [Deltaproteobacteria bacterium]|nr:hypothetical protein [Deltaproteobacteria bacterium]